ncbi:hypothetical protein CYJ97_16210 [Morganella morganii]|nr:hypothetical protein CYJ97_16210 [Morganella morganii]
MVGSGLILSLLTVLYQKKAQSGQITVIGNTYKTGGVPDYSGITADHRCGTGFSLLARRAVRDIIRCSCGILPSVLAILQNAGVLTTQSPPAGMLDYSEYFLT